MKIPIKLLKLFHYCTQILYIYKVEKYINLDISVSCTVEYIFTEQKYLF